jgi:hypothetical protein
MDREPFSFRPAEKPPRGIKRPRRRKGYVGPRQVENYWNFYKRGMTVAKPGRGWPAWLIPLIILVLIVALVFWAAPTAINRIRALLSNDEQENKDQPKLLYGSDTWTVVSPVADIFDRDDLKAGRLSQALYNEPVRIISRECEYGFVKVRLSDNLEGYMLAKDLAGSHTSIEPDSFTYKLVVVSPSKRIMSHANKGTLLVEVMMGTILFADYRGSGVFRVVLPGGGVGWLSEDGIIVLPPFGQVKTPADGARYFCSTAMAFNQITSLDNGQSILGISTVGIARQAAAANGLILPRTLQGLAESGSLVSLSLDETTRLASLEPVKAGDLLVLADQPGSSTPGGLAIYMGDKMVLYAAPNQSVMQLLDLTRHTDLWGKIIAARRLFAS